MARGGPSGAEADTVGGVVTAYLNHLVVERGIARNTLDGYARDLRRYTEHLSRAGVTRITDVTAGHVTRFAVTLRDGEEGHHPLAESSAARALAAVRGLHRFAHAD
ncbi:site-specific integrase, partial [Saccharomonospora saliphila]|uniref:site-specific integrase n=1 Tax=Saccharomonospora saliphila TaxID=369829 RepID=UPI0006624CB4